MKNISKSVLRRLPTYLTYLKSIEDADSPYISATALAAALGMGEVQVRKDLAMVSDGGRPKIGYPRDLLIKDIAYACGFENEYYFSNFFKKHIKMSPSDFRNATQV